MSETAPGIIFEHPLNERVRTLLRLEFLFRQLRHFAAGTSAWDSRRVVESLDELLNTFARGDLRNELVKELERHHALLAPLADKAGVDQSQLGNILRWLERLRELLHVMEGQPGQALREDELLGTVRQRCTIPGGTCDFDLPVYHHWLQQPAAERHTVQERWLTSVDPVRQTVDLLLKLIRNSADPTNELASGGRFHRALDPGAPYQLLRIAVAPDTPCFAEISGGRHRFAVRFLEPQPTGRPRATDADIPFQLTCCLL